MILIEHRLCALQIVSYFTALGPGDADHPIQITTDDRGLGRHRRHHLQFAQFGVSLFKGLLRHTCFFDLVLKFINLVGRVIHFPQLFLNRLHLLIQVVLALAFLHLLFDTSTNALFHLTQVNLRIHE